LVAEIERKKEEEPILQQNVHIKEKQKRKNSSTKSIMSDRHSAIWVRDTPLLFQRKTNKQNLEHTYTHTHKHTQGEELTTTGRATKLH
jgi:hypothetical protein